MLTATDGPGSGGSALRGPAGTSYRFDIAADVAHTVTASAVGEVVGVGVEGGADGVLRTARIAGRTPVGSGSPDYRPHPAASTTGQGPATAAAGPIAREVAAVAAVAGKTGAAGTACESGTALDTAAAGDIGFLPVEDTRLQHRISVFSRAPWAWATKQTYGYCNSARPSQTQAGSRPAARRRTAAGYTCSAAAAAAVEAERYGWVPSRAAEPCRYGSP